MAGPHSSRIVRFGEFEIDLEARELRRSGRRVPLQIQPLAVLESAKGISSDHEMSELLIAVTHHVRMDDTIRAAIRSNAGSIGSQYDRGRVYEALSQE